MSSQTPPPPPQNPALGAGPVALGRETAARVWAATLKVERFFSNRPPRSPHGPGNWDQGAVLAKLGGSTIAARSGTTLSSGTVTLQYLSSGVLTAESATMTAYNLLNKVIAANSYVVCVFASGDWVIVAVDDCAHLS